MIGLDGRMLVAFWIAFYMILFLSFLPHKRYWIVKSAGTLLLLTLAYWELLLIQSTLLSIPIVIRTGMIICGIGTALILNETDWLQACYMAIWAMMMQQTLHNMSTVFMNLGRMRGLQLSYPVVLSAWMIITAPLVYAMARTMFRNPYRATRRLLAIAGILFAGFELVQGIPDIKLPDSQTGLGRNYQFVLMNGICLLIALYLSHTLYLKRQTEIALIKAKLLHERQKERYEVTKRTIDLVNRRCHELKIRLAEWKSVKTPIEQEACLERLSEAIDIYDSRIHTGNDAMDTLLAEQSLYCEHYGFSLHHVVHGDKLGFMTAEELYTLCLAMFQYAMRVFTVKKTDAADENTNQKEQQEIGFYVFRHHQMIVIELSLPLQQREEEIKSIPLTLEGTESVVHQYHMQIFESQEGEMHVLRALIPEPKS